MPLFLNMRTKTLLDGSQHTEANCCCCNVTALMVGRCKMESWETWREATVIVINLMANKPCSLKLIARETSNARTVDSRSNTLRDISISMQLQMGDSLVHCVQLQLLVPAFRALSAALRLLSPITLKLATLQQPSCSHLRRSTCF